MGVKKVFAIKRKIRLSDTDATGCIYFINQLKFASEAFELLLEERIGMKDLSSGKYSLPIVDVRSQYFAPLRMGDEIEIQLQIKSLGLSSIDIHANILKDGQKVGQASMKHVFISTETKKSTEIPEKFRLALSAQPVTP